MHKTHNLLQVIASFVASNSSWLQTNTVKYYCKKYDKFKGVKYQLKLYYLIFVPALIKKSIPFIWFVAFTRKETVSATSSTVSNFL